MKKTILMATILLMAVVFNAHATAPPKDSVESAEKLMCRQLTPGAGLKVTLIGLFHQSGFLGGISWGLKNGYCIYSSQGYTVPIPNPLEVKLLLEAGELAVEIQELAEEGYELDLTGEIQPLEDAPTDPQLPADLE